MTVGPLLVLLVEESVRRGTHVLVELPEGMDAETAQRLMKEATGFEPDKQVKGVDRCIYMVPEGHTKYVSDRLFEYTVGSVPVCTQQQDTLLPSPIGEGQGVRLSGEGQGVRLFSSEFKGVPYTSIICELAANLRAICDDNEEWLLEVMPRYGLSDQEMKSIIHSACKEPTKGSRLMDQIVSETPLWSPEGDTMAAEAEDYSSPLGGLKRGSLPIGLKESLAGVPASMYMPVLCGVLPIAAAYADQVEVEYCDGNLQHLGLMSIIRGEQASNKSVVKNAVDVWKRQFEGSTLLKRFKNAQGHTLYSFGEELDTLRKTNGAGSWSSKYDIYRLSFDKGEWGQDYNSDQAESGVVKVAYNWTMLGTYGAMRKCFKQDNIENGLSSRILVAEMPDSSFQKMPKFGRRSAEDEARIQEAVTRLRSFTGLVDTPRLRRAIEAWVEQKRVEAAKDIDHVKDTYRKRAAVIGFRCGVVFHLLASSPKLGEAGRGLNKESKTCIQFALMMAEYCLSQQIKTFGEALQNQYVEASDECQRYGANHSVFDQLAPTFTVDDLRALKRGFCTDVSLRKIISRWMRDGWIDKTDSKHWSKVKTVTS